ncbi:hypothetical protein TWF730_010380 [Orbilia blumenaviensis]|uniref:AAA+ ATPase domain-containing protein n=1 Tax=Orbilia blumenaviensis TaxID=1796055 RepID=A0AAV9UN37_9PEZI
MRSRSSAAILQKTYDQTYLTCSTAIYFESKANEDEALRSWKEALLLIQSYERSAAARKSSGSLSLTEKALIESLGDLKLQCLDRIDTIEVLRLSRQEEEEKQNLLRHYNGGTESPNLHLPSQPSAAASQRPPPYLFMGQEDDGASLQPPHDRRPSGSSIRTSSTHNLGGGLPPNAAIMSNSRTRSSSPEKKGLLATLRNSSGGSGSKVGRRHNPKPTGQESVAAAARAATRAWSGGKQHDGMGRSLPDRSTATLGSRHSAEASPMDLTRTHSDSQTQSSVYPSIPPLYSSPSASNIGLPTSRSAPASSILSPPPPPPPPPPPHSTYRQAQNEYFPDPSQYLIPPHEGYSYTKPPPPPPLPQSLPYTEPYSASPSSSFYSTHPDISSLSIAAHPSNQRTLLEPEPQRPSSQSSPHPERTAPPLPPKKPFMQVPKVPKSNQLPVKPQESTSRSHNPTEGPSKRKTSQDFKWPANPQTTVKADNAQKSPPVNEKNRRAARYTPARQASNEPKQNTTKATEKDPVPEADESSNTSDATTVVSEEEKWKQRVKAAMSSLGAGVDRAAAKQILNEIVIHGDEVHWEDIAGLDSAKLALKEAVVYPFLRPDLFRGLREPTRGMLLFGPPGTGKTMLARAVATESKSTFFSISSSSLTSKYLGESEKLVRALFQLARALAPSIIFVDEIDSLLSSRQGGEHEATLRIKTEFLIQWSALQRAAAGKEPQGADSGDPSRVLVLAATNLPWAIDEAARRRFVRRQYIPLPEGHVRAQQIHNLLGQQKHLLSESEMRELEALTEGFSGSDITALAKDAAMGPLRSAGESLLHMRMEDIRPIMLEDFRSSLKSIRPSVSKEGLQQYEDWAKNFGERAS